MQHLQKQTHMHRSHMYTHAEALSLMLGHRHYAGPYRPGQDVQFFIVNILLFLRCLKVMLSQTQRILLSFRKSTWIHLKHIGHTTDKYCQSTAKASTTFLWS